MGNTDSSIDISNDAPTLLPVDGYNGTMLASTIGGINRYLIISPLYKARVTSVLESGTFLVYTIGTILNPNENDIAIDKASFLELRYNGRTIADRSLGNIVLVLTDEANIPAIITLQALENRRLSLL